MTKILEVYKTYKIMPQLQQHQLRVAAVAKQVCDNIDQQVNRADIITACLLHDMGNIIKFDLQKTIQVSQGLIKQEELGYWQDVKDEFIQTYGQNEHKASLQIAKDLGASANVINYISNIDFGAAIENAKKTQLEPKICDYADLRISPDGVVSIVGRLEDGKKRYKDHPERWVTDDKWEVLKNACLENERQIFAHLQIKPTDITDKSIQPIIEQLKEYEI
jgi:hypothetical protein